MKEDAKRADKRIFFLHTMTPVRFFFWCSLLCTFILVDKILGYFGGSMKCYQKMILYCFIFLFVMTFYTVEVAL